MSRGAFILTALKPDSGHSRSPDESQTLTTELPFGAKEAFMKRCGFLAGIARFCGSSVFCGSLILGSLLFGFSVSFAADIGFSRLDSGEGYITITGEIRAKDAPDFITLADSLSRGGIPAKFVVLDSPGGQVMPALEIARRVSEDGMGTVVLENATCASACFLIFISGSARAAMPGASMYVHRISDEDGDSLSARGYSVTINDLYRKLKVPDNIRMAMLDTPPGESYRLTEQDLRNISTLSLPEKPAPKPQAQRGSASGQGIFSSGRALATPQNPSPADDVFAEIDRQVEELAKSDDLRSGIWATDAYYRSIPLYDTRGLDFEEAAAKLARLIPGDRTGIPEYLIGKMYQDGLGGNVKQHETAWYYYEKAANKGNGLAIFRMGMYFKKHGRDAEAVSYILKAVKMMVPAAVNYLGYISEQGIMVPQDYGMAILMYYTGYRLGSDQSSYALGNMFLNGIGVDRDLKSACALFRESASRGNLKAERVYRENCR